MAQRTIGQRMKHNYEEPFNYRLPRRMPLIIRLDGKTFHSRAKQIKLKKPFDENFIQWMQKVALHLCENIMNARLAYLQSDEISILVIDYESHDTESWFNHEVQKLSSVTAGIASSCMSLAYGKELIFDSRCFVVPESDVCNYFIWRQKDWIRNSIQMLGRSCFSHKELHELSCNEIQEKLWQAHKINWAKQKTMYKRGSCIVKDEYGWHIDDSVPDFTKKRGYIEKYLPELNI